jgi:predicted metal-binding protein
MEKVAIVGCGAHMDSGYGCAGKWRCLKAAAVGDGNFDQPAHAVAFVRFIRPGEKVFVVGCNNCIMCTPSTSRTISRR